MAVAEGGPRPKYCATPRVWSRAANIPWQAPLSPGGWRGLIAEPDHSSPHRHWRTGVVAGQAVALGNTALMEESGVDWRTLGGQAETLRPEGAASYTSRCPAGGRPVAVSDPVKASTPEALELCGARHRIIMATGDGRSHCRAVGHAWHRQGLRRGQPRTRTRLWRGSNLTVSCRRHGRRRHQRCTGARASRYRYCYGHRH